METNGIIAKNALDAKRKATSNYQNRGIVYYDFDARTWGAVPRGTAVGHFEGYRHVPHNCLYFRNDVAALEIEELLRDKHIEVVMGDE